MENTIFFTYRRMYTDRGNRQDVSFYNDKQYSDFVSSGLTKMTDGSNFIPDERITAEIAPWVKSLRVAGMLEYKEPITKEELEISLENVAKSFSIELKTSEEIISWIEENTDLVYEEGKGYLISEADEETEAKYLLIV